MEINLSYRDVENILQTKFHINHILNPSPLWYFDDDEEFDDIGENKLDDIVIKLRVTNSDLI